MKKIIALYLGIMCFSLSCMELHDFRLENTPSSELQTGLYDFFNRTKELFNKPISPASEAALNFATDLHELPKVTVRVQPVMSEQVSIPQITAETSADTPIVEIPLSATDATKLEINKVPEQPLPAPDAAPRFMVLTDSQITKYAFGAAALVTLGSLCYFCYKNGSWKKVGTFIKKYPYYVASATVTTSITAAALLFAYQYGYDTALMKIALQQSQVALYKRIHAVVTTPATMNETKAIMLLK